MKELLIVTGAVTAAHLTLWGLRVWAWVSYSLRRWPWLLERYAWIFPVVLVVGLVLIRLWPVARSTFLGASLAGASVGVAGSVAALLLAQLISPAERVNLLNSLGVAGAGQFLLVEVSLALLFTLGWLYGGAASLLAVAAERVMQHLRGARQPHHDGLA